ncbi:nitroreductase family protein [Coraliomargarita sp. SDUM461004]|uniref:Nitroreductase family protein n=1 Tax=Thalassobacterium sedimentorum TaxID=3041258 RepID=A0ABU1ANK1_9BACT|nr:nitroreductase family protein [Coraliomargarita sp. SDUM461004]MDQ8196319.1 nitroreductase family protein [Coraliomargarita sp. SDUM461004]
MNTLATIEARRSIKHYDPEHEMPEEDLARLIELTKLAPSSFNMQNYRMVVVRDPELRKQIRAAAWDQAHVTDASVLFIMCADLKAHEADPAKYWSHAPQEVQDILGPMILPFYQDKPQLIRDEGIRSTAFAGMTLMLAAKEMGYGSCPMIGFDGEVVSKLINVPEDHVLSFIIAVGKEAKPAWPRGERLSDSEVVIQDRFA